MEEISFNPSPKNSIFIIPGNIYFTKTKQEIAVNIIETQFPIFNAPCTCFSLASLFLIFTNIVPIIENKIPKPAIAIGNKIGPIPPNTS